MLCRCLLVTVLVFISIMNMIIGICRSFNVNISIRIIHSGIRINISVNAGINTGISLSIQQKMSVLVLVIA